MEAPKLRPTSEDRVKAALWFAERGFGVFPCWSTTSTGRCRCPDGGKCGSPGKHPVTLKGFHDATTNPTQIATFLAAGSEPNYGLVPPEGVFVWDVDTDDERARMASLEAAHGPLPPTLHDRTAHGEHVFLRWPEGIPRPLGKMFGYVTRWGSGRAAGYVIGPRSVHADGTEYAPAEGTVFEIAELPEAWARAAVGGDSDTVRIGGPTDPSTVVVGGRHDFLRNRARLYAGTVRNPDALFAAVWADNEALSEPKTAEEVRRAIGDALTKFPADPVEEDPDTGEIRHVTSADDALGILPAGASEDFPAPPAQVAFGGLLGECVMDLAGGTDASLVGLLGSLVAICGALLPGHAYFHRDQTSSPFVALVGESSIGRKGTAMTRALDAMSDAIDRVTVNRVVLDGLSSGEGLVSTLAWKQEHFTNEPTVGLVFEEEYAVLLASRSREGSTLDPKMRAAFDGGPLSNRRSSDTKTVTPPYWLPALIAITPDELRLRLESGAFLSGSANRWLYLPVIRREVIPSNDPPRFSPGNRSAIAAARRGAAIDARAVDVDPVVTRVLAEYADFLAGASHGLAKDLTKRLPVIAFRIALVHAMAERSVAVTPAHLERALALTEYARGGIRWVFGNTVGNRDADLLLRHLIAAGRLRKRSIAREIIRDPLRQQGAIDELLRWGNAHVETVHETGGRPRTELVLTPSDRFDRVFENAELRKAVYAGQNGQKTVNARDTTGQNSTNKVVTEPAKSVTEGRAGTVDCRDYVHHQSFHHRTPDGWACTKCDAENVDGTVTKGEEEK